MDLLALAFVWVDRTGVPLHDKERPIPLRKPC